MSNRTKLGKSLRIVAIILMGLTAVFTLIGGFGTICIAWFPEKYESLAVVAPYKIVYQIATIFTIAAAVGGIWATVRLLRSNKKGYALAVGMLLLGIGTAGLKMYYSNMLRGSVAPTHIRFYLTIVTLILFLILRLPAIWQQIDLDGSDGAGSSGLAASFIMLFGGIITLTTPIWAGASHMMDGYNLVLVLERPLFIGGGALLLAGIVRLVQAWLPAFHNNLLINAIPLE